MGYGNIINSFWKLAGAVSIRTKMIGIMAAAILLVNLIMVWYAYNDVSVVLRNELEERAVAIGNSLARQSRNHVLTDNQFALYNAVTNTVNSSKDIVYAFVLDHKGNVLVHSFKNGFPTDLLTVNYVPQGASYRVQRLHTEQGNIIDVAVPILEGTAGVSRLGISELSIELAVTAFIKKILVLVGIGLALGLLLAFGLASLITKPLSALANAAKGWDGGDFQWEAPPWARDELGELGATFGEINSELKQKDAMRALLLAKIIHAQEEERKRISRELHDESGQILTSLMVNLKATEEKTESKQLKEQLASLRAQAAVALDRLRHLSMELRPSLLDDIGLASALHKYVKEYAFQTGISVDCRLGDLKKISLTPDEETTIYRIVQEALTNIVKHAEASKVRVVTELYDSKLVMIIEDNGNGFDVNELLVQTDDRRLGIFGMEERASLIGGRVTIESIHGEGTSLFFDLPIKVKRGVV